MENQNDALKWGKGRFLSVGFELYLGDLGTPPSRDDVLHDHGGPVLLGEVKALDGDGLPVLLLLTGRSEDFTLLGGGKSAVFFVVHHCSVIGGF